MPSCILRWQWTTYTPTALYQTSALAAAAAAMLPTIRRDDVDDDDDDGNLRGVSLL